MLRIITAVVCYLITLLLSAPLAAAPVKTGAEVLYDHDFAMLQGQRFGLVTNRTARIGTTHLIDQMIAAGTAPAIIFAPEHGLRGAQEDGIAVVDELEQGIPVRSLYGEGKMPRQEDLQDLDLLLFDIQDIGARFYTYISTMGLVMQAAARAGVPLLVLDRPNPLGGNYVSGFVRHGIPPTFTSFYPIPVTHGMTVGELALMIRGEALLSGLEELDLAVVRMAGWERWMRWPDTGLPWVATSPNITDFETSLLYAGLCFLEGTGASEGRGTMEPFLLAGWPGIDSNALAKTLNQAKLPGVRFEPALFTPRSLPGRESDPKFRDIPVHGIRIQVTEYDTVLPVETGVAVTTALYRALSPLERAGFFRKGIDDLAGTVQLRDAIIRGDTAAQICQTWEIGVESFMEQRLAYLLYQE